MLSSENKTINKAGDGGASFIFFLPSGLDLCLVKTFHMGTFAMQASIFVSVLFLRI